MNTIIANPLLIITLAFVILGNVFLLLILLGLRKSGRKHRENPTKSNPRQPSQATNLLRTIQNQMENQQNLLQFMGENQQGLLRKMEDIERSIEKTGQLQAMATAPQRMAVNNPQPTPMLSPADHLVQVLQQGGDRAALAQWPAVKVKITAASQNRIYQGFATGVELEPARAGASFLIFQVNGEHLLVPNQETMELFQRRQRGHTGLFVLERQPSLPRPQVSKPARVQPQGKLWRVVEQGEILIRG